MRRPWWIVGLIIGGPALFLVAALSLDVFAANPIVVPGSSSGSSSGGLCTAATTCTQAADLGSQALTTTGDATCGLLTANGGIINNSTYYQNGAHGESAAILQHTTTLTFAGGGGDASKQASALIPVDSVLLSVGLRVNTTGSGCSTLNIGDGSVVDIWGKNISTVSHTTSVHPNAQWTNPIIPTAGNVVVTGNVNCVGTVVRVTVWTLEFTAPSMD
jgi:hypothetical protein